MSDPGGIRAWLTPENLPSGTRTFTVPVPDDLEWIAIFKGALALLTNSDNFQQFGVQTPADVAERFMEMFLEIGEDMMPIGTILEFAGSSLPDKFLWADGSLVAIADEPELFEAIGYSFGSELPEVDDYFYLPDKRGRVGVGLDSGQYEFGTLGKKGGAKTITLSIGEMPSHTHIQNPHTHSIPGALNSDTGTARRSLATNPTSNVDAFSTTATNQNTGGGQAHNNLQPYVALNYIIRSRA